MSLSKHSHRFVAGLLLAAACCLAVLPAARAQVPGGRRPDVQIIVFPHPSGKWSVSAVYPKKVGKPAMQAHVKRLFAVSGWSGTDFEYEYRGLATNDGKGRNNRGPADPAMSSVTFLSASPLVDWKDRTLPVEPWARAFRDLDRVYVTFFVPGQPEQFVFRGLRRNADDNLEVVLAPGANRGGAYTYLLHIKNHRLETLNLPRFQVVQPEGKTRTAQAAEKETAGAAKTRRVVGMGLVLLLAVGAAVAMFFWTHRFTGR